MGTIPHLSLLESLHAAAEPAPFDGYAGYADWSAALDLPSEPPPAATPARFISEAEWLAIIGEPVAAPPAVLASTPTPREERGRELAETGRVTRFGAGYVVEGSTRGYFVQPHGIVYACECLDWTRRIAPALEAGEQPADRACKHGHAVEHAIACGFVVDAREGK
jgi:hypothetical protein